MRKKIIHIIALLLLPVWVNCQIYAPFLMKEETVAITDPTDINNCVLWLDANDMDNDGDNDTGAAPATWSDKSGQSHDFTRNGDPQIVDADLNGLDVCGFDGTGDYYTLSAGITEFDITNDWTWIVIGEADNTEGLEALFTVDGDDPNGIRMYMDTRNTPKRFATVRTSGGAFNTDLTNELSATTWYVFRAENDASGTQVDGWLNGTQQETPTDYSGTITEGSVDVALQSGSSSTELDGRIAVVIGYSRILTAGEISQLTTWISTTYGLTGP